MTVRIKLRPKFSFGFLGVSVGVEWPEADPLRVDGPPVSDGRFERARQLAAETVAALQADDLPRAVDRLLALADEYPAEQRAPAVMASNRARLLADGAGALSDAGWLARKDELIGLILDTVATYVDIADLARGAAGGGTAHAADRSAPRPRDASDGAIDDRDAAPGRIVGPGEAGAVAAVRCQALGWNVGDRRILRDVTVDLMPGSIVGVVGANGAGKTTLLRLLAQELRPSSGAVSYPRLHERGYRAERLLDRIAYVPQIPREYVGRLETHLRRFAALRGLQRDALDAEVAFVIERFGLGDHRDAEWTALAGGFRTRVDLARSTLASPDILILDEPLGPLDSAAQREYLRHIRDLADSRRDICVVITSQDVHALVDVADHIIVIRDGSVPFSGPPDLIERMSARRSYEFAGDLAMDELERIFRDIGQPELRDEGTTRVLVTDDTVTANDVLRALVDGGETVRYFRDLSRSPQALIEDRGRDARGVEDGAG